MNSTNLLEHQLRSLKLRKPAPEIQTRLFADAADSPPASDLLHLPWRSLAAVCAALMLLIILSPSDRQAAYFASSTNSLLETLAHNSGLASYWVDASHSRQNVLDRDTFEWTNGTLSTTASFPVIGTNRFP